MGCVWQGRRAVAWGLRFACGLAFDVLFALRLRLVDVVPTLYMLLWFLFARGEESVVALFVCGLLMWSRLWICCCDSSWCLGCWVHKQWSRLGLLLRLGAVAWGFRCRDICKQSKTKQRNRFPSPPSMELQNELLFQAYVFLQHVENGV